MTDSFSASGTEERLQQSVLPAFAGSHTTVASSAVGAEAGEPQRSRALESAAKRTIDLVGASLLLLVFSPVWLLCAILVKVTSRGPVLFRQQRLGVGGSTFTMLKFRTMENGSSDTVHREFVARYITGDAELAGENGTTAYKLNGDRRITMVGRLLRKLSIDEVPQLINVVRGDMSLVGPRPPLPYEVEHYQPWQRERLSVRPGITGLWQVSGRNRLTHAQMCRLDIRYIRSWSLGQDLAIMLRTPWVMLIDRGGAE